MGPSGYYDGNDTFTQYYTSASTGGTTIVYGSFVSFPDPEPYVEPKLSKSERRSLCAAGWRIVARIVNVTLSFTSLHFPLRIRSFGSERGIGTMNYARRG